MKLNDKNVKRLAVFFFFDEKGIVDDYIIYLLNDLKQNIDELLFVSNGKLCEEGRAKVIKLTNNILERENKGFDVWAYKEGIEYYGWDKLANYDEIILLNYTIFGPLFPFKMMFDEMNKRDLDFWGITKHHKVDFDAFGTCKYGYIPEHIQSSFLVIRNHLLTSNDYQSFWNNMPMINSYADSVGLYEAIFTKDFMEMGYKGDVFVNTDDLREFTRYPLMMMSYELVKNRKCPVIKRKSFSQSYYDMLSETVGESTMELYEYIRENFDYDVNLIWDNILRTCHMADIKDIMHLNYILPLKGHNTVEMSNKTPRVGLVMHLYFMDLLDSSLAYAANMPDYADIIITTNTEEKKALIDNKFKDLNCNNFKCIVIENRGRDVSSLLVGARPFIMDYDYVCFAHDKKTSQLKPYCIGEGFSYKCFENILGSKDFVYNIIDLFDKNPKLGLLTPPPPNHAAFYQTLYSSWANNYNNVCEMINKMELDIPVHWSKEPIAPLGTMFWFRPKAMLRLFDENWTYDNFPEEPNNVDGTLLHAIERLYPYIIQNQGFYCGWLMNEKFARIETTNLYYLLRLAVKNQKFDQDTMAGANTDMIRNMPLKYIYKVKIRDKVPKKLWKLFRESYYFIKRKK